MDKIDSNLNRNISSLKEEGSQSGSKIDPQAAAMLAQLQGVLQTAQAAAQGTEGAEEGPSSYEMMQALASMGGQLALLQADFMKASEKVDKFDRTTGIAMINQMKQTLHDTLHKIEEFSEKQQKMKGWSLFVKVVMGLLGGIASLASLMTGQVGLAVLSITLLGMSYGGGFEKATHVISQFLQAHGVEKHTADLLAGVLVVTTTIALTAGASAASSLSTATETGAYAAIAGSQAMVGTNVGREFVDALPISDSQVKHDLELTAEVVTGLVAFVASMVSGKFLLSKANSLDLSANGLMKTLQSPEFMANLRKLIPVFGVLSAGAQGGSAVTQFQLGNLEASLGEDQGMLQLYRSFGSLAKSIEQSHVKSTLSLTKEMSELFTQLLQVVAAPEAAVAHLIA